jgi:hypothetical protein
VGILALNPKADNRQALVLYHYYEKDQSYIDNFAHFLRFGYDSSLDYLIVIAGEYSVDLPSLDNIQYLFTENKNFDYGGYCEAIQTLDLWKKYDFYLFINSSVRGPFLLACCNQNWTNLFLDQLSDEIGIIGSAISITPSSHSISKMYHEKYGKLERNNRLLGHVQTTCYALSREVLGQLIKLGFYDENKDLNKDEAVRDYEIRLSQSILDMGLNLRCMLPEYNQVDYRKALIDINPASREGDSGFERSYFGRSAHPYESIFIKTSRATYSEESLMRFAYSMATQSKLCCGLERRDFMQSFIERMQSCAMRPIEGSAMHRKGLLKSFKNRFK